jgi:hypothetical protein
MSSGAILVCLPAVQADIAGVLDCQIDVLLPPPGEIEDVTGAPGISVVAARDGRLRGKCSRSSAIVRSVQDGVCAVWHKQGELLVPRAAATRYQDRSGVLVRSDETHVNSASHNRNRAATSVVHSHGYAIRREPGGGRRVMGVSAWHDSTGSARRRNENRPAALRRATVPLASC